MERQIALFKQVIDQLEEDGLTFADWLAFIFSHERDKSIKALRREHFWRHRDAVQKVLGAWVHSQQTESGRALVEAWVIDHVAGLMRDEARAITRKGILRSANKSIGPAYLKAFKISNIKEVLQTHCPTSVKVLLSMAGVDEPRTTLMEAPMSSQNVSGVSFHSS